MRRFIILSILLVFITNIIGNAQSLSKEQYADTILKDLKAFIDSEKKTGFHSLKYIEYVLVVYKCNKNADSFCYTISSIYNSSDYLKILPSYYFKIEDDYVLVRLDTGACRKNVMPLNLLETRGENSIPLVQRLYPSDLGGVHATYKAVFVCFSGNSREQRVVYDAANLLHETGFYRDIFNHDKN